MPGDGGAGGRTVGQSGGGQGALWHRMIADQGYIVASVDNRGTPAPKGRAWRKVVYGEIGVLSSREQADAVRALTRPRPYLAPPPVSTSAWTAAPSRTPPAPVPFPPHSTR